MKSRIIHPLPRSLRCRAASVSGVSPARAKATMKSADSNVAVGFNSSGGGGVGTATGGVGWAGAGGTWPGAATGGCVDGARDTVPDAADEPVFPDRREDHAVVQDLLDLVKELLALLPIELARLALEEVLHLGHDAVGVDAALRRDGFDARGRVTAGADRAQDDAVKLLLPPRREPRRAFHRAEPDPDADRS